MATPGVVRRPISSANGTARHVHLSEIAPEGHSNFTMHYQSPRKPPNLNQQ